MDSTVIRVNPLNSEPIIQQRPEWYNRLICVREYMTSFMMFIAWLTLISLLVTVAWIIIRHS